MAIPALVPVADDNTPSCGDIRSYGNAPTYVILYDNTPICDTPPDVATASAAGTPKAAANTPSILYITNCSSTRHHRAQVLKVNSDSVRLREAHWAHPSPAPKLALCHRPAQHPKLALGHKPAQHPSSSPAPKLVLSHRLARHPMLALGHSPDPHPS